MPDLDETIAKMRTNPEGVRFVELCRVCDFFFGKARQKSSSHRIYRTPWQGDPRVNIQRDKSMAKIYQVKQVLRAIEQLEEQNGDRE